MSPFDKADIAGPSRPTPVRRPSTPDVGGEVIQYDPRCKLGAIVAFVG
jgi:hypothetical protein